MMNMRKKPLSINSLRAFWRGDDASLTVEAVLVLPLLLWAFLSTFAYFDIYRARTLALKANYAVADLLSRETNAIDMAYLNGAESVFEYLTQSGSDSWLRVTEVRCRDNCADPDARELRRSWSRATDGVDRLLSVDIDTDYRGVVPMVPRGERVIMVETLMPYEPPFLTIFSAVTERDMSDLTMTRPRFAPQLCWVGRACGNT